MNRSHLVLGVAITFGPGPPVPKKSTNTTGTLTYNEKGQNRKPKKTLLVLLMQRAAVPACGGTSGVDPPVLDFLLDALKRKSACNYKKDERL